jgi:hypothetical protein
MHYFNTRKKNFSKLTTLPYASKSLYNLLLHHIRIFLARCTNHCLTCITVTGQPFLTTLQIALRFRKILFPNNLELQTYRRCSLIQNGVFCAIRLPTFNFCILFALHNLENHYSSSITLDHVI